MRRLLSGLALWLALAGAAAAVEPGEMLDDPALETRARAISQTLRCLVCQNQSIDDSNADLAHDLRVLVRERIKAGDSDAEVVDYIVARYGDFVLLEPPVKPVTWALWYGPPALLAFGAGALALRARRRRAAPPPLDGEEEARLARLLADRDAP